MGGGVGFPKENIRYLGFFLGENHLFLYVLDGFRGTLPRFFLGNTLFCLCRRRGRRRYLGFS